jgi:hypothetical protein
MGRKTGCGGTPQCPRHKVNSKIKSILYTLPKRIPALLIRICYRGFPIENQLSRGNKLLPLDISPD